MVESRLPELHESQHGRFPVSNNQYEHSLITIAENPWMRAFRTFLILVLGLIAGGYLGFWFARLLTADDVQLRALERQINHLHEQVETGELMLAGNADILARHIEQTEQLRDENQSLIRALERAREENIALKATLADAGIPTSANER